MNDRERIALLEFENERLRAEVVEITRRLHAVRPGGEPVYEPIDDVTASALQLWKEDHEAQIDLRATRQIQERTAAVATLDRLLRLNYLGGQSGEGRRALTLLAEAAGVHTLSGPSLGWPEVK